MSTGGLSEAARFEIDQRLAQTEVVKALVLLLGLNESADEVQLRAVMADGFVRRCEVTYTAKGVQLGGFGL